MDFKVIFKDSFLEDFERVVRSIADQNPSAAAAFGELVIRMAEGLRYFPERHPSVCQRTGIRRFIVRKHFKVFYRVLTDPRAVEIPRLWDGRRGEDPAV